MKEPLIKPTDAELEILNVLWKNGPSTVREIHQELTKTKDSGYTTTLKLMQIMFKKGILIRTKHKRSHIYKPAQKEEETKNLLLNKFVNSLFHGSTSGAVMQLLGNNKTSAEELSEIRKLIDEMEDNRLHDDK